MRVFVTGGSGLIGSALVPELIGAGHQVVALARSDESAAALAAAGAEVRRGDLQDLDVLRSAAADSDGVVHLAFIHDFLNIENSVRVDRLAVEALCTGLEGSGKPFVTAGGTLTLAPGRVATERDTHDPASMASGVARRLENLQLAMSFIDRGVCPSVVRLAPSTHSREKTGFLGFLVDVAREKGVAGYVGDGTNRWPGVHKLDAARVFRLALEKAPAGAALHAIGEEGIEIRDIAEVIGRHLGVPTASIAPEDAAAHFSWMAPFISVDSPASSALTRELLGWEPTHPGLLEDLDQGHYFDEPEQH